LSLPYFGICSVSSGNMGKGEEDVKQGDKSRVGMTAYPKSVGFSGLTADDLFAELDSMPRSSAGPMLVAAGVVLAIAGLLVWAGAFRWFGKLPGDIRIERPNSRIYIPLGSSLLVSVVLSLLLSLIMAIIRRFR
jgi:hypothetical protein